MRPLALAAAGAALALVGVAASSVPATHDPRTGDHRTCYEDEVVVWSGGDNAHTHCIPLDDLPRMLWQECVALAEGTDRSYEQCDEQYGTGHSV